MDFLEDEWVGYVQGLNCVQIMNHLLIVSRFEFFGLFPIDKEGKQASQ